MCHIGQVCVQCLARSACPLIRSPAQLRAAEEVDRAALTQQQLLAAPRIFVREQLVPVAAASSRDRRLYNLFVALDRGDSKGRKPPAEFVQWKQEQEEQEEAAAAGNSFELGLSPV